MFIMSYTGNLYIDFGAYSKLSFIKEDVVDFVTKLRGYFKFSFIMV